MTYLPHCNVNGLLHFQKTNGDFVVSLIVGLEDGVSREYGIIREFIYSSKALSLYGFMVFIDLCVGIVRL